MKGKCLSCIHSLFIVGLIKFWLRGFSCNLMLVVP
jgi:hypothetical protein